MKSFCVSLCRCTASLLALGCLVSPLKGAQVRVDVGDNFFRPAITNIIVGDSVRWAWIGLNQHSSTHNATPRLWDSGLRNPGATFTNTFNTVGSFPYFCTVPTHTGQNGTINVGSGNPPPSVVIQSPTNTTVYAAPATVRMTALATSTNSTITNVAFLRVNGNVPLGNDTTAPYEGVDNNPLTGTFGYRAVATDALGEKATNTITVSIVNPVAIRLTNQVVLSPTQFRLTYSGNPGLYYVVEKSATLDTWQGLATNRAAGASITYTDEGATAGQGIYRVRRMPNP